MIKEIEVGGMNCRLKSSAAVPRIYREIFGGDLIVEMNHIFQYAATIRKLNEELEKQAKEKGTEFEPVSNDLPPEQVKTLENFAYVLNKHGDHSQPDTIEEWLEQFRLAEIYDFFPVIIDIWFEENEQTSIAKKKTVK